LLLVWGPHTPSLHRYNFWDAETRLSKEANGRLRQLLTKMYDPRCESQWLHYAPHLLLSLVKLSPDFELPVFQNVVAAKYTEQQVQVGWDQAASMRPAFSYVTQGTQATGAFTQTSDGGRTRVSPGFVRATQAGDVKFAPTQAGGAGGVGAGAGAGAGAAAGAVVSSFMPASLSQNQHQPLMIQSALVHGTQQGSGSGGGIDLGPGFAREGDLAALELASQGLYRRRRAASRGAGLSRLRVAHNNTHASFFQRRALMARSRAAAYQRRARQARRKRVQLYRRYRKGEMPDVEIKLKDLSTPLQALCELDPVVARHVLAEMFKVLYASPHTTQRQCRAVKHTLGAILKHTSNDPGFVACVQLLLEACHATDQQARKRYLRDDDGGGGTAGGGDKDAPAFVVDPQYIGESAFRSMNFAGGVRLLEAGLAAAGQAHDPTATLGALTSNHRSGAGGRGRRGRSGRGPNVNPNSLKGALAAVPLPPAAVGSGQVHRAWRELTRLYQSLGDTEIVLGLVDRNCVVPATRVALEAQLQGDFKTALAIYEDLLSKSDEGFAWPQGQRPHDDELCAWDDGRAECLVELRQWDVVMADVEQNVPHLRELITDAVKREQNLGMFMRAGLRLPASHADTLQTVVRSFRL